MIRALADLSITGRKVKMYYNSNNEIVIEEIAFERPVMENNTNYTFEKFLKEYKMKCRCLKKELKENNYDDELSKETKKNILDDFISGVRKTSTINPIVFQLSSQQYKEFSYRDKQKNNIPISTAKTS